MGVRARIRRRSRSSSRQLRPSGAKRRGITVMTSPPSASKSAMGSSRRLSREPGQGAWAPPRQHAGNSRWPCLNSHANGHDNGRQHASGLPRCSWPERDLAQHSAISPNTARDARGQSAISPNTARSRPTQRAMLVARARSRPTQRDLAQNLRGIPRAVHRLPLCACACTTIDCESRALPSPMVPCLA
jgi:hypothetical protein